MKFSPFGKKTFKILSMLLSHAVKILLADEDRSCLTSLRIVIENKFQLISNNVSCWCSKWKFQMTSGSPVCIYQKCSKFVSSLHMFYRQRLDVDVMVEKHENFLQSLMLPNKNGHINFTSFTLMGKQCMLDKKFISNANKKPSSDYRLVTILLVKYTPQQPKLTTRQY